MMINYCFKVFERFIKPGSILEMGPAEGIMTEYLVNRTNDLTLVDGSAFFCNMLKEKYPQVNVINVLFENFHSDTKYDNIILGHVLEHVDNPVDLLKHLKLFLNEKGRILAAVPNSHSLHRQAAVLMNIIKTEEDMSELDVHHGHRRIYNPFRLRNDFTKAGFSIEHFGGYWLKPISNSQIDASWSKEMLWGFMKLGERYPDIAGEIYVIATL
ncbi:MAG: class I SAM-dependent methyltransferase [Alphaproteobacteria bacterium]|nr:class I SAM-dependent methyltransferase [Alphaproteobacteria bacterium]